MKDRCARCGGPLTSGCIMSMYNTDIICMTCKNKETRRMDYKEASMEEHRHVVAGDTGYAGILSDHKKYQVSFIWGMDLKMHKNVLFAKSESDAVEKTFEKYGSNFENELIGVNEIQMDWNEGGMI